MKVQMFWVIIAGCVLGVLVRTVFSFGWVSIGFLIMLAGILLIALWVSGSRIRPAIFCAGFLLAFALGAARMHTGLVESEPLLGENVGSEIVIEGIVTEEPDVRENTVRLPVRIVTIASSTPERAVSILVVAPLHTDVAYGDVIRARGELQLPDSFETSAGRTFNYPGFLAKDGILYTMSFAQVERTGEYKGFFLKAWAIWLKQEYLVGLTQALTEPQAGLAGGITVGDKRGLGEDLSETFRIVGLTHIIVLSGYNIMVVVDALLRWLSRAPQMIRLGLAGFVALFFAAITGFASASTRAACMAMIAITGKATGRTYLASRALALVAVGMIFWNPYVLAYDPGFQLSVIATTGLIFLTPIIEPLLIRIPEQFGIRGIAAASIGTQIAVVPLLLYQNGTLTMYALPANLLSLIIMPAAMLFSALAAFFGLFAGFLAPIFGLPAYALLTYVIFVAERLASFPFSAMTVPAFSALWLIAAYASLLFAIIIFSKRAQSAPQQPSN